MSVDTLSISYPSKEFADSLFNAVNTVSAHTDTLSGFPGWVTWFSFIASIITIIGLAMVGFEIYNRRTTKTCQKKIILDLIRHFLINNAISEVIRLKMEGKSTGSVLREGIMKRFCVLDSDIELGNLSYSSKSYELLHSIRIKLRNYNIAALCAEKHFTNPNCPNSVRLSDLDDIWDRSAKLTEAFMEYAKKRNMGIDKDAIRTYIKEYYEPRIEKWKKDGKIDENLTIPIRDSETRTYYDKEPFELKDIVDQLVRVRYSYVSFTYDDTSWMKS